MPSRPNIAATIFRETAACPERTALIEGRRSLTYAELAETVGRLARALDAAGVRPLDRVAFLCPDGIDYVLLSLAILLASCVAAVWVGAKIYENSLLRMGGRGGLAEALRG